MIATPLYSGCVAVVAGAALARFPDLTDAVIRNEVLQTCREARRLVRRKGSQKERVLVAMSPVCWLLCHPWVVHADEYLGAT